MTGRSTAIAVVAALILASSATPGDAEQEPFDPAVEPEAKQDAVLLKVFA